MPVTTKDRTLIAQLTSSHVAQFKRDGRQVSNSQIIADCVNLAVEVLEQTDRKLAELEQAEKRRLETKATVSPAANADAVKVAG